MKNHALFRLFLNSWKASIVSLIRVQSQYQSKAFQNKVPNQSSYISLLFTFPFTNELFFRELKVGSPPSKFNIKVYDVTTRLSYIYNAHIVQYLTK